MENCFVIYYKKKPVHAYRKHGLKDLRARKYTEARFLGLSNNKYCLYPTKYSAKRGLAQLIPIVSISLYNYTNEVKSKIDKTKFEIIEYRGG